MYESLYCARGTARRPASTAGDVSSSRLDGGTAAAAAWAGGSATAAAGHLACGLARYRSSAAATDACGAAGRRSDNSGTAPSRDKAPATASLTASCTSDDLANRTSVFWGCTLTSTRPGSTSTKSSTAGASPLAIVPP